MSSLPTPTLYVMPVEPGCPISLGHETDLADAAALLGVLCAAADSHERRPFMRRVVREARWGLWEEPRLPRPLVQSKYPVIYPWSLGARAVFAANSKRPAGGYGLVIEHCIPGIILIRELIERAHDLTPESLIDLLSTRLTAAVITREENKLLDKVGLQARMPDGADPTDPWARYRAAGLHPDEFKAVG